jgi:murein DD-endopeptidase MepM/ murein hydrolase activator NlpD
MKKSFWLTIALGLCAYLVLPMPGISAPLSDRIQQKQKEVEQAKQQEGVLTTTIQRFSNRIDGLQGEIQATQDRLDRAQSSLDRQKSQLLEVRDRLEAARDRLSRLRAELATARRLLAARLVEIYKSDTPDVVTVVLEADGFRDLLESAEFMQRVSKEDARIIARVTKTKEETAASAARLDKLERRAQEVARAIEGQVQQVVAVKTDLVDRRNSFQAVRAQKAEMLASTKASRHELEDHVASLEREQSAILAKLQSSSSPTVGPVQQGSGGLIWPVSGPVTSGFGYRWGRLHAGVDIAVPIGTPIRAAASGRVAIAGWVGGYGNYTCIQHSGSLSTCYGHQNSIGVSVGSSVSQGQVIGASGNTGHSTGPHVHFETRINGNPVDPMGYL